MTLLDTAGIRESDDPVEQEGIRRAAARAAAADLVLWVIDGSASGAVAVDSLESDFISERWLIRNKADLLVDKLWNNCESTSVSSARHF